MADSDIFFLFRTAYHTSRKIAFANFFGLIACRLCATKRIRCRTFLGDSSLHAAHVVSLLFLCAAVVVECVLTAVRFNAFRTQHVFRMLLDRELFYSSIPIRLAALRVVLRVDIALVYEFAFPGVLLADLDAHFAQRGGILGLLVLYPNKLPFGAQQGLFSAETMFFAVYVLFA